MIISEKNFCSFLFCNYKHYLDKYSEIKTESEFDIYAQKQTINTQESILLKDTDILNFQKEELTDLSNLKGGITSNITIKTSSSIFTIDFLTKHEKGQISVGQLYSSTFPLLDYKLLIAWKVFNFKEKFNVDLINCYLINQDSRKTQIKINRKYFGQVEELIKAIEKQNNTEDEPKLFLNEKCRLCGAKDFCKTKAIKNDDLSLLSSLKKTQIKELNNKGIFSITQLSYTFKPRRQLKKQSRKIKKFHVALKALAIREKKVFVFEKIDLPQNKTRIYVDIETIPYRNTVYLISCIIEKNEKTEHEIFWCDERNHEQEIFIQLIDLISCHKNIIIFHFGQIERKLFERLHLKYNNNTTKRILESSYDLFAFINPSIYFPTYTNGLKDILNFIGFKWNENLEGYKSVFLRLIWEQNKSNEIREKLIQYNKEDCQALITLYNFLLNLNTSSVDRNSELDSKVIESADLLRKERKRRYGEHLFDAPNFIIKQFDFINKCSYFDYQRNKILIKSNKTLESRKKK